MTPERPSSNPFGDQAGASLTAIVITYNTREMALTLLADLRTELEDTPHSRIMVVDNASADGTADAVANAFPDIILDRAPTNLGFGAAVNRAANGASTDWLLLVNPDARIDPGSIASLMSAARQRPGHGLYGARLTDANRATSEGSVFALPTLGLLLGYASGAAAVLRRMGWRSRAVRLSGSPVEVEVEALPGTFVLIEREAWEQVGSFDERFFMYCEDFDLCARMIAAGRRPLYVPQASMRHVGGASSARGNKEVMKLRSTVTYIGLHWSPAQARIGRLLLVAGVGLRRLVSAPNPELAAHWRFAWGERHEWLEGW